MKKETEVEIFGNRYIVRSETEEEYTRQLAKYVDGKMKEVAGGGNTLPSLKVAILAALSISNELFVLTEKHRQQNDYIDRKATKLISILDTKLEEKTAQ